MFFEPPAAAEKEPGGRAELELPSWVDPPAAEIGTVMPLGLVVARSANAVVVLPAVRAYSTGCLLLVDVASRQESLSAEDWWDLSRAGMWPFPFMFRGGPLPSRLMRFGVRYPDGTKATTVDRRPHMARDAEPPPGPLLSYAPGGGGVRGAGHSSFGLWLWPLPPAEPIEFAVEWPVAGIGLTIAGLDGAAIVAAAGRTPRYWEDA